MSVPRADFSAATLPSGKVLLIGGQTSASAVTATVDLYDPATNSVTPAAPMSTPRRGHSATGLLNGKVLVAGGVSNPSPIGPGSLTSAEIYDPVANTWTAAASMAKGRSHHAAILMPNGKVFVAGGGGGEEIYDPNTNTWTGVQPFYGQRSNGPVAAVLQDGRVFIYGGQDILQPGNQYEFYDPATGQASYGRTIPDTQDWSTAAVLPDGSVLIVGGQAGYQPGGPLNTTLIFNALPENVSPGPPMNVGHCHHTMTTLKNSLLLVVGGGGCGGVQPNGVAELFDPVGRSWSAAGTLATPRGYHAAAPLFDGRVLVAGGFASDGSPIASIEVYSPA